MQLSVKAIQDWMSCRMDDKYELLADVKSNDHILKRPRVEEARNARFGMTDTPNGGALQPTNINSSLLLGSLASDLLGLHFNRV